VKTSKRTGLGSVLLLLSAGFAFSQPPQPAPAAGAQAAPGRSAQGPRVVSPEILPDNRVTFRLSAPKATEVIVNGDWPGGRGVQLTKDSSGVWSVTTQALSPEIWSYTFSVNGVKIRSGQRPRHSRHHELHERGAGAWSRLGVVPSQ
jgi:enterochelin esterase family protein